MSKYLKIPQVQHTKKITVKRAILPKVVTGEEFRRILLEKKRKRKEIAKQLRKLKREQKPIEKEKERKLKQEQKQEKAEERAKKLKIKQLLKQKEKQKQKRSESSYSESDCSMRDVCYDSNMEMSFDTNVCYKCGRDSDESGWIGCQRCCRFFHRSGLQRVYR